MPGDTTSPAQRGYEDEGAWREIETLIDEASCLAATPMSGREFYVELLRRLMQATGAVVAAGWSCDRQGHWQLEYQAGQSERGSGDDTALKSRAATIATVASHSHPRILPPSAKSAEGGNKTAALTCLVCPIAMDGEPIAALEVFAHPNASPTELRNHERITVSFADVVTDFHRRRLLRELRGREHTWSELDQFAVSAHRSLDLRTTAFTVANEAVRVVGCDRVTILSRCDKRYRVVAVSGIDTVQRRAAPIRALETLVRAVVSSSEPVWYAADAEMLPPELERPLQAYLDTAHVRAVAVLPLRLDDAERRSARESLAVAVFERFDGETWTDNERRRVLTVCRHSTLALHNSQTMSSMPLRFVSNAARRVLTAFHLAHLPKTIIGAAILGAIIASLIFVPGDFDIRAHGELQPRVLRHIFAPADGVIEQVHAAHGQAVTANESLVELRRPDLDLELSRVLGDLQTTRSRLDAVRASRLSFSRRDSQDSSDFDELTAEEERLKTMVASLEQQRDLWLREQTDLIVRSPIEGEVLTWNVVDLLADRPVHRGQKLMTVADTRGEWRLELQVSDHDVEHIRQAQRAGETVPVRFLLASHTGQSFEGVLEEVGMATEIGNDQLPVVPMLVNFDRTRVPELHPGATVIAQVHCGERSIGYVWCRQLIEVVRTRLWL